jgi:hypothetical protein
VKVRVTAVIVSSMGAVYGRSMKDLQKVLRCNDKEMKKLARQMSETVIVGSMEIWRKNAQDIARGTRDDVNELIAEEGARMEEARVEVEMEMARERERERARERARERNIANNQNEAEDDFANENGEDAEEFEDEEEEEEEEEEENEDEEREAREAREEGGDEAAQIPAWRIPEPEEGIPGRRNGEEIQRNEIVEPEEGQQLTPLGIMWQAMIGQERMRREVGNIENAADDERASDESDEI